MGPPWNSASGRHWRHGAAAAPADLVSAPASSPVTLCRPANTAPSNALLLPASLHHPSADACTLITDSLREPRPARLCRAIECAPACIGCFKKFRLFLGKLSVMIAAN